MSGIYIHIPFCKQKCSYCDFHFSTNMKLQREMTSAICAELKLRKTELSDAPSTIYFGGGSPSILKDEMLGEIFETLHTHFDLSQVKETTLETNPDDHKTEKLAFWKSLGIDRLSIGIQSFHDRDLQFMNRAHNSREAAVCVENARMAGFKSLTIDLIYGIPGQSIAEWQENVHRAIDLDVDHVSAYCLTIEKRTAMASQLNKGEFVEKQDVEIEAEFMLLRNSLAEAGFMHYEISNFAKAGKEALHNSNYWNGHAYLGIGPSAHSFNGTLGRSWNVSNNAQYIKGMQNGSPFTESEILNRTEQLNEQIMTGLRIKRGLSMINWSDSERQSLLGKYDGLPNQIKANLKITEEQLQMNPENWLLADDVIRRLMF